MSKISISLPDHLVHYVDDHVENRSALIEILLEQWKQQKEDEALALACAVVDELELGWSAEWQSAAISDLEASGL
jgi:Arc/MetJ-type ribon-helix-helix transcriptional regulator